MSVVPFPQRPPRGVLLNNPLNIKKTDIDWRGEVDGNDPIFEQFATAEEGIRAGTKNILAKYRRGVKSVGALISTLSPPTENDTIRYVRTVSKWLGVEPDQPLDLESNPRGHLQLTALVECIIRYEQGKKPDGTNWYSADTITRGVNAALES